mgnify:CR=1 FL=1|tara:strand:- start:1091 stop:1690 length:600 start_codon:yes stop_codon:yes gene_type:complete
MRIEKRKISELIRAEYNPRKISVVQLQELKDGIEEFGLVSPLVVNEYPERKNVIVGGHQRLKLWEELGNTEVDCSIVNLPLDKEKKLNIKLNKNGGTFDDDLLKEFFDYEELIEWGFTASELFTDPDNLTDSFSLPDGEKSMIEQITFTLSREQVNVIKESIKNIKETQEYKFVETFGNENSNGNSLYLIIKQWEEQRK